MVTSEMTGGGVGVGGRSVVVGIGYGTNGLVGAMAQVEKQLPLIGDGVLLGKVASQPNPGKLLALVDLLQGGTLNEMQVETLQVLRAGLLALAEGG